MRSAGADEGSAEDTIASKDIIRVTLEHVAGCMHWYLQHREGWTLHFNEEFGGAADVSNWLEQSLGFRRSAQIAGPGGQGTVAWSRPERIMRAATFALIVLILQGCGSDPQGAADSGQVCFPCEGYWICGGEVTRIDLMPAADGCYLSGLPGRNLLSPDGTITADGAVVGSATGSGARVQVAHPDGTQWLYCAGAGGC